MRTLSFLVFVFMVLWSCKPDPVTIDPPTEPSGPTPYKWIKPPGFAEIDLPTTNPLTVEGVRLGRRLFYEKRLSGDNTMSCGSCHLQDFAFAEPNRFSTGIDGIEGTFNAPPIMNLAWQQFFFWDGRSTSLEQQAELPVEDPIEMHETWPNALDKLANDPMYRKLFKEAFNTDTLSKELAAMAIAQFERTVISSNSKFDRFNQGFERLDTLEAEGYRLFNNEEGDCFHCHGDKNTGLTFGAFGAVQFSNNGIDSVLTPNTGLERVTGLASDRAKFKIPSLRNVEYTAPYMHDGRFYTLEQVIEHYNMGGHQTATIDPNMKAYGVGRNWTFRQKIALVAFLKTLSDPQFISDTNFSDPFNR